jgi:transcriptional regulator with XRE-family HTH domain
MMKLTKSGDHSDTAYLIELALKHFNCRQEELAQRLNVSPTQIVKWKNDEYMSPDMTEKICTMLGLGDREPRVVALAGSIEAADKWETLIDFLAESAVENAETGYETIPLTDERHDTPNLLVWKTFDTLRGMGVDIPTTFPSELAFDYRQETPQAASEADADEDDVSLEMSDETWGILHQNPYSNLIYNIYEALNDIWGYYAAYVSYLINDDALNLMDTTAENIEPCLLDLAASKLQREPDESLAPRFQAFKRSTLSDYKEWLRVVQDRALRARVPLREDIMELVYKSHPELGSDAERNSLGLNEGRLHPDVYMNELLVGMQAIHQVLPVIMKKLGIYDGFTIDTAEFNIHDRHMSRSPDDDEWEVEDSE